MYQESESDKKPWLIHPIDFPMDARIIIHIRANVRSIRTLLENGRIPGDGYRNMVDASGQICQGIRPVLNELIEENTPNLDKLASRVSMPLMRLAPNWMLRIVAAF